MINLLSVIIPTYNPDTVRLNQTLAGLQQQTLALNKWELIIVNNNSSYPFNIDLSWHNRAVLVDEPRQGLTYARLRGFNLAKGELIVLVDDDNVLEKDYLLEVLEIFMGRPDLGAAGGKSLPVFEAVPPDWLVQFYGNLALRDPGEKIVIDKWDHKYPAYAPLGAGLSIRKASLMTYIEKVETQKDIIHDRKGNSLSSGGDNDIVLEILKDGWAVGYFPKLILHHIIPQQRMQVNYLARLVNNTNKSWVILLESHGINPWAKIPRWTVSLRKFKSWFTNKAWKGSTHYIRWRGACGMYDGLAEKN